MWHRSEKDLNVKGYTADIIIELPQLRPLAQFRKHILKLMEVSLGLSKINNIRNWTAKNYVAVSLT